MYKTRNGFTKGAATDENISEDNGQYMVIVLFFWVTNCYSVERKENTRIASFTSQTRVSKQMSRKLHENNRKVRPIEGGQIARGSQHKFISIFPKQTLICTS